MAHRLECPFCGYRTDYEYVLTLHIEEHHTEDSPFVGTPPPGRSHDSSKPAAPTALNEEWIQCTRRGCGEFLLVADLEEHLAIHELAEISENEDLEQQLDRSSEQPKLSKRSTGSGPSTPSRTTSLSTPRSHHSPRKLEKSRTGERTRQYSPVRPRDERSRNGTLDKWFRGFSIVGLQEQTPPLPPRPKPKLDPGRLGRRELGPHAFESRMPDRVRRQLITEALPKSYKSIGSDGRLSRREYIENETLEIVDVLADLSALDRHVKRAYFCRPNVRHVRRIHCEGNFCGYWNIQMVLSSLQQSPRVQILPNVLQIQDTIEEAWDAGLCTYSRTETGGIRGSRKWIGSMEATAYFMHTGVPVSGQTFQTTEGGEEAHEKLLDHVEAYFMSATDSATIHRASYITQLPPIYLQRQGHSLTIVGLQRWHDGYRDLLVFDPSIETARAMRPVLEGRRVRVSPENLIRPYRRSERHLSMWKEFEIVQVNPPSG